MRSPLRVRINDGVTSHAHLEKASCDPKVTAVGFVAKPPKVCRRFRQEREQRAPQGEVAGGATKSNVKVSELNATSFAFFAKLLLESVL